MGAASIYDGLVISRQTFLTGEFGLKIYSKSLMTKDFQ